LCYNTKKNCLKPVYPFPYSNGLSGHGLLHCPKNDTMIVFGGAYYDYILCSYQFVNDFWIYCMQSNQYQCVQSKTLPRTINGFGYILFANRIIITFGGSVQRNKFIDNIYWTDILSPLDGWKEAPLTCPKKGGYHALLVDNRVVHLIHFGKEQFCMNIKDLLPSPMVHMLMNEAALPMHKTMEYSSSASSSSNFIKATHSVQQVKQQQNDAREQLLVEYENRIQQLQCDQRQKEFMIVKLQTENQQLRMNYCNVNNYYGGGGINGNVDSEVRELRSFDLNIQQQQQQVQQPKETVPFSMDKDDWISLLPPVSGYTQWTYTDILEWICNLENGRFNIYQRELNNSMHRVVASGTDLEMLTEQQLQSFVTFWLFDDASALYKRIQLLIANHSQ